MAEIIEIKKSDTVKQLEIQMQVGNGYQIFFVYKCDDNLKRDLLYDQLHKHFHKTIEDFAKENYLEGIKHGRAKSKMKDWFPSWLSFKRKY